MSEQSMQYLPKGELKQHLEPRGNMPASCHIFEAEHIQAVNAAIACQRPLLILGEPGTGSGSEDRSCICTVCGGFAN